MQKELLESIVCLYCKGSIEQGESILICRNYFSVKDCSDAGFSGWLFSVIK